MHLRTISVLIPYCQLFIFLNYNRLIQANYMIDWLYASSIFKPLGNKVTLRNSLTYKMP